MASGNIGATSNNTYVVGNLSWSSTTNTAENYSDVYAELRMWRNNSGYTTSGTGTWTIGIDGNNLTESRSVTLTQNSNTLIIATTVRIYHNSDGTKQVYIGANGGIPGTSYTTTSCGATVTLDTIARASQPTISDLSNNVINTFNIGSPIRIHTNRADSSFTHTLRWGYGTLSGEIQQNVGLSWDWTPPLNMCTMTPASIQGYGEVYVDTYSGGTFIGTKATGFYANVPSTVKPTFTSITTSEMTTSPNIATIVGKYVQGLSSIRMFLNGANGIYNSTVNTFKYNLNNVDYTNNGYITDSGVPNWSGTKTLTGYVIDTRGIASDSRTINVEVLPYAAPNVSTFTVQRCTQTGVLDEMGTYAKIVRAGTASSLINGTEKNTIACNVYYKERTSGTWIQIAACTVAASASVGTAVGSTPIIMSSLDAVKSYDFKMDLIDKFNTTTVLTVLSVGKVVMSWGQTGVGIGKVWESGELDVAGTANIETLTVKNKIIYSWPSANTGGSYANYYAKIASLSVTAQYGDSFFCAKIVNQSDGGGTVECMEVQARLKQQAAMGSAPNVEIRLINNRNNYFKVYGVLTVNTTAETRIDIYVKITQTYMVCRLMPIGYYGSVTFFNSSDTPLIAALPAGTQYGANENLYVAGTPAHVLTGTVIYYAFVGIPTGYLYCDGAAISRTTYVNLFNVIGTAFGAGDGSTTFNIPDLRGEFIRSYDNGAGRDPSRGFGTWQDSDNKTHQHWIFAYSGVDDLNFTGNSGRLQGSDAEIGYDQLSGLSGGNEARPRNVALLACIKY